MVKIWARTTAKYMPYKAPQCNTDIMITLSHLTGVLNLNRPMIRLLIVLVDSDLIVDSALPFDSVLVSRSGACSVGLKRSSVIFSLTSRGRQSNTL